MITASAAASQTTSPSFPNMSLLPSSSSSISLNHRHHPHQLHRHVFTRRSCHLLPIRTSFLTAAAAAAASSHGRWLKTSGRSPSYCRCSMTIPAPSDEAGLTYRDAGVDIDAGAELVRRIAKLAPAVGGFGGLFPLGDKYLVAGTDGVGTKLKLAFETGIHDTIGIDLVAMSVNDIVTSGAKPLFFLDYFATSRLDVDLAERVIKGIINGCEQSDCKLLGGETAEMPDFYKDGEYDLSGFAVGIVDKDLLIDGKSIVAGDILIGLPSSGVHSNGFSLVRRVLEQSGLSVNDELPGENAKPITIGEALMAPTIIYVKQVLEIIGKGGVKGIAHITGGGFTDNIPRVFPKGLGAAIDKDSWDIPPIFSWIQEAGRIEDAEMRRTFNMGIGMVLVVSPEAAAKIFEEGSGESTIYQIGKVINGNGVTYV